MIRRAIMIVFYGRASSQEDAHWLSGMESQSKRFTDWPTPLGAVPCEGSLLATHLRGNPGGCQIVALATEADEGQNEEESFHQDFVMCAWLER